MFEFVWVNNANSGSTKNEGGKMDSRKKWWTEKALRNWNVCETLLKARCVCVCVWRAVATSDAKRSENKRERWRRGRERELVMWAQICNTKSVKFENDIMIRSINQAKGRRRKKSYKFALNSKSNKLETAMHRHTTNWLHFGKSENIAADRPMPCHMPMHTGTIQRWNGPMSFKTAQFQRRK